MLFQAGLQQDSAEQPFPGTIFSPGMTCKVSPDYHFNGKRRTLQANAHVRIRHSNDPVRDYLGGSSQKFSSNLIEYLSFIGNGLRQDHIEGRNPVACNHYQQIIIDRIYIPYLTVIKRSEEHTSELKSLMRISYAVFCLK